jgi:hypothetical protein
MTQINIDLNGLLGEVEMTQTEFAKAIGFSRAQFNKAYNLSSCSVRMMRAIRKFATQSNINIDFFLDRKDRKHIEEKNVS